MEYVSKTQEVLTKYLKIRKVMSQKDFAYNVGVSVVTVTKWLNGSSIDSTNIPAICKTLNITPNELFGYQEKQSDQDILYIVNNEPELKRYVLSKKK